MSDISDVVLRAEQKETSLPEGTSLARKLWDVAKAVPVYAAGFALGGAPLLTSMFIGGTAYSSAYALEQKFAGNPLSWRGFYREAITGSVLGGGSYGVFRYFSGMSSYTASDRFWKTAKYVGLASGAGVPVYRGLVYLREEVGFLKALKGLYDGSIRQYLKDAWNYDIKKNWARLAFKTAAVTMIPYHLIINYVHNTVIQVAAQKAFTFISRLIMGGKNLIKKSVENTTAYATPLRYTPDNSGTLS